MDNLSANGGRSKADRPQSPALRAGGGCVPHSAERAPRALAGQAVSYALRPYVPRLLIDWLDRTPAATHRTVDGTLLFADISGFTSLTERLARHGRVGAEEMSDALNATFGTLVAVAADDGADLIK